MKTEVEVLDEVSCLFGGGGVIPSASAGRLRLPNIKVPRVEA